MEELVLADTDVVIDYFNGISPTAEIVADLVTQERLALTTISVFELYAGVVGKKRLEAIELLLKNVVILPLSETAAREAAKIFTELKSKGKLIGNQDLLIAATSLIHELPLLTRNKSHFQRIQGLHLFESDQVSTSY